MDGPLWSSFFFPPLLLPCVCDMHLLLVHFLALHLDPPAPLSLHTVCCSSVINLLFAKEYVCVPVICNAFLPSDHRWCLMFVVQKKER